LTRWRLFSNALFVLPGLDMPVAGAAVTWAGRIISIGPRSELLGHIPAGVEEISLGARLVTAGLVDAHVHLLGLSVRAEGLRLDIGDVTSVAEAQDRIREHCAGLGAGEWVWGGRWDANLWPGASHPTAADLDAATGDRPAALTSRCGHAMWVNTAGLRAAGIGRDTPDPEGGRIARDESGEPTGMLYEGAMAPMYAFRPRMTRARTKECLLSGIRKAHSLGLVGVHNCEGAETFAPLLELANEGALPFRVTHHIPESRVEHAVEMAMGGGLGGAHLRVGSLKVFVDGSLGARPAAMLEPYADSAARGIMEHNADSLAELGRRAAEAGLSLAVHAIGDRAVRETLDAFERLRDEGVRTALPHRMEHAQHIHPDDVGRLAKLGVIASVQPVHLKADQAMVERHLHDRGDRAFVYGSLLRSGATLCFGSDAPVETLDPLRGISAAVKRSAWRGGPRSGWHPAEKLRVREALDAYTHGPAVASGTAHLEGAIAPGYRADFTVLSHDILSDADAIEECRVAMTVVAGRVVYDSDGIAGDSADAV